MKAFLFVDGKGGNRVEWGVLSRMVFMKNVLNYIWISNRDHYDPERTSSGSPVPAEYLNNAFQNARENPEVTTLLWCDYSLLSEAERTFLETHPDKPETFSFRDLNQIPSYGKTALFGKTNDEIRLRAGKGPDAPSARIWQKVDLVRLLVLEHLFKTTGAKNVFYSDLDIINPQLTSSFAVQALKKHGMIVNMYGREGLAPKPFLENQFMAFSRSREKDVSEKLIPAVRKSYQDGHKNGWVAFCQYARKTVPDLSRVAFLARTLWPQGKPQFNPSFGASTLSL